MRVARGQGSAGLALASAGFCTVLAILDASLDEPAVLVALQVLGPLIAATGAGPRATALVAVYAFGLAVLLGLPNDDFGDAQHVLRCALVLVGGALATLIARLGERAERIRARATFLAEASSELDRSLDLRVAADTVLRVAVPRIADWAAVYVKEDDGAIRQVSIQHRDPEKTAAGWTIDDRHPIQADQPMGVGKVIRTGQHDFMPVVPDELIAAFTDDEEHARLVRELGLRSAIFVPLRAHGQTFGALALATAESGRVFDRGDLELALDLGARASLALANARLYTQAAEAREELRRSADEVEAILRGVGSAITVQDTTGSLVFANDAAARMLRMPSADAVLESSPQMIVERFEIRDEDRNPLPLEELPGRKAMAGERPPDRVVFFRDRETGEERWSIVKATPIFDEDERVSMVVNIFDDITDQKRSELSERLLSEASRLLSGSLDYETTLDNVAHLAVPGFADWCAVELVDDHGATEPVAVAHADPSRIELAERLRRRYPSDPHSPTGVPNVIRTGEAELYAEVTEQMVKEGAQDEEHLAMLLNMGLRSAIVAPLVAGGRTLGAITFVTAESGRRFESTDMHVAVELGRRAGSAVQNARLYAERTHIAKTLQRSLLPPVLPDIPGVEVAARFRPAGEGYDVGGDFYDLFNTGAGWAVAIGDVCGKGPEAAALTGLARHTLRAAAMQDAAPAKVLSLLSEAIRREHSDSQFCTAAYLRLEPLPEGARLTIASGGHPLPVLLTPDGRVEEVGTPGTLLGAFPNGNLIDQSRELPPGAAVVLYTDGVIEAGNPRGSFGAEGLQALLASCAGMSANEIAERIDTAITGLNEHPPDDVAVLVLRIRE